MLRLKAELLARGITQVSFAKTVGIKPQALSRIIRGVEPPYPRRGQRIADALGYEGDYRDLFEQAELEVR